MQNNSSTILSTMGNICQHCEGAAREDHALCIWRHSQGLPPLKRKAWQVLATKYDYRTPVKPRMPSGKAGPRKRPTTIVVKRHRHVAVA